MSETVPQTLEVRPLPDSPAFLPFENPSAATRWCGIPPTNPTGASFAPWIAPPYQSTAASILMRETECEPTGRRKDTLAAVKRVPDAADLIPALAPFAAVAHPESMHLSFDIELRDRIFNPILRESPRIRFCQATAEPTRTTIREARVFEPVGFRWQRNRKIWDRGVSWRAPSRIGRRPDCDWFDWPGLLSVEPREGRQIRFN
jgi:hypothetical protein